MSAFRPEHVVRTHHFELPLAPRDAFHFFTPEGERAWAPGWEPRYLHPEDGRATAGMVFTTGHGDEETLWIMTRHEPGHGLVEYSRVTPGSRMGTVRVACTSPAAGRTRVTVTYMLTGLSEASNATLRAFDAGYERFIDGWGGLIRAVVSGTRSATTT